MSTDLSQPQPQPEPQPDIQPEPQPDIQPEPQPEAEQAVPVPVPVRRWGRGRWLALVAVGVLLAVATGAGVGEAILDGEQKPVQATPVAEAAAPSFGTNADGSHYGSLGDLLLPVPGDATPGPDDQTFGNDTVLTSAQYQPFFNDDFGYLASGDRSRLGGLLDVGGLKSAALRSYQVSDQLDVEIGLFQVAPARVVAAPAITQELANVTGGFTGAATVTGFPKARCYKPPLAQAGDELDYMDCEAVSGDLLVTVEAYGAAPMDSSLVTNLLMQQLTRLGTPEAQT